VDRRTSIKQVYYHHRSRFGDVRWLHCRDIVEERRRCQIDCYHAMLHITL
jgi:hypothetical protein